MSQAGFGREVRSSRFAGVTRVGFRVVVVAGFAGAAWAMSASAANAAVDSGQATATTATTTTTAAAAAAPASTARAAGTTGTAADTSVPTSATPLTSSVLSLVGDLGTRSLHTLLAPAPATGTEQDGKAAATGSATNGNVLTATVKPLLDAGGDVLAGVLVPTNTVPTHDGTGTTARTGTGGFHAGTRHVAAQPVRRTSDIVTSPASQVATDTPIRSTDAELNGESGSGSTDLVRTVTGLVAPLGFDQIAQPTLDELQPMTGVLDPLTAPLDELLSPITGVVETVTTPIFDSLGSVTRPLADAVTRSTDGVFPGTATAIPEAPSAQVPPSPSVVPNQAVEPTELAVTPVRVDGGTPAQRVIVRHGTRGAPHRYGTFGAGRSTVPASPAPVPALPASMLGGIPTTVSGSHEGSSEFAVLSIPVVNSSSAAQRLAMATGFTVRRHLVENPTVSPD